MSAIRLYLDEDSMRRLLAFGLRARGVDVLTAAEAGMINRPDEDQLDFAANSARALYTYNVADYCLLHQEWMADQRFHAGIVASTQQRYVVGEELRHLVRLISEVTAEEMRNRVEFLSSWPVELHG